MKTSTSYFIFTCIYVLSLLQRGKELLHSSSGKVQDTVRKVSPYASQTLLKISTVSKLNWFNKVKLYPKRSGRVL